MSFLGKLSFFGLVAAFLGACATQPPPITKLVGGRQITSRSVDPTAYEHVSRALIYEEQERWQDAVAEIQHAILFDEDAPELHAHLAELFLRLGRDKDAESEVRASLKLGPSASGLLADAHVRLVQGDAAGQVAALRRATNEVEFAAGDDDAEAVYLELAEAELHTLDLPSAQNTLEVLTQAEPASASGHMRLTAVYWALGAMTKAEAALHAVLTEEPNQIEALAALAWMYAASGKNDEARLAEPSRGADGVAVDPVLAGLMGSEIARLLNVGHSAKPVLCHLGLAPQNVMVMASGEIVLLDCGIAASFRAITDQPPERWAFVAPELQGVDVAAAGLNGRQSVAADLYSLGALVHFLVTGQPPALPPGRTRQTRRAPSILPDIPGVSSNLGAALRTLLSPEPEDRPESAAVLVDWLAGGVGSARDRRQLIADGLRAMEGGALRAGEVGLAGDTQAKREPPVK